MTSEPAALYNAFAARDPRFDGVFYVGVTSTGIYCRPVCTARTPKAANCRFFESAGAAEKANFRPCLRCRPELAPGNAPVDDAQRIAALIVQRIEEGMVDEGAGIEHVAAQFGWSARQIRRIVQRELGVSPIELVLTRRLLLAKQLLTETTLPITQVAFASGFASLRRFNDAFNGRYGMPPTRLRSTARQAAAVTTRPTAATARRTSLSAPSRAGEPDRPAHATFSLQLAYRPPFDWAGILRFLDARATRGVEMVDLERGAYLRTVRLGEHTGWVRVTNRPDRRALSVELPHDLTPVLPALLGRLRHLFDLSAQPEMIDAQLARDPLLAPLVARTPGLRVPGAFDGFELAVRAVLGQQVTVKGATTVAGRVAAAFGEPVRTPYEGIDRLAPTAERIARCREGDIASLGIIRTRAQSIIALARAVEHGALPLEAGGDHEHAIAELRALPGIGAWTAQYIAMRALRWPDAFPKEDVVLRKALGGLTSARAEARAGPWRPWRSYATLHLWRGGAPAMDHASRD
ncbi:MAG TPA: AlkA N-terminal domain-containing protein [Gemmatimonadaceae bacterium]|nr:AlkA N-terminal domain-containing protein [Gemmatimonadaceae bacterium]